MTGPLHITAALTAIAELHRDHSLPMPSGVRIAKASGIATIEVATFAQVVAWGQALGAPNEPMSHSHEDGSSSHSVWLKWHGWDLKVGAWVEPPEPVVPVMPRLDFLPSRAGCPNGCTDQFADTDCPTHGVVAMVKAAQS